MNASSRELHINEPSQWIIIGHAGMYYVCPTLSTHTSPCGMIRSESSKVLEIDTVMDICPPLASMNSGGWHLCSGAGACPNGGVLYPRKDMHGGIDFRIQWHIKAYKKADTPPKRVKPVPIIIIIYIMAQAYDEVRSDPSSCILSTVHLEQTYG
jgi:hypothetical protein